MKKLVLIILIGLLVVGCKKPKVEPEIADMGKYGITTSQYYKLTMEESAEFLESGTGLVLYGFAGCPWCDQLVPVLTEILTEQDIKAYYIDVRPEGEDIRNHEEPGYSKIIELTTDFLGLDKDGNPRLYVPQLFAVKNGKVLAGHSDTVPDHDASERKMTEEEIVILQNIIIELLEKIK